jgi:hypothetical protein
MAVSAPFGLQLNSAAAVAAAKVMVDRSLVGTDIVFDI